MGELGQVSRLLPDRYTFRARLQPALLAGLPLTLPVVAWLAGKSLDWRAVWVPVVWFGGSALAAQIVRDRGKRREKELFQQWGGKPSVSFLRHREARNRELLRRRHGRLQELLPDVAIPSAEEELQDPEKADEIYEVCSTFLRSKTRDNCLVFEENCNYGFRRNLWSLKPFGLVASALGVGLVWGAPVVGFVQWTPAAFLFGGVSAVLMLLWVAVVKPDWVRAGAEVYAERLLEASEDITSG